MFKKSFRFPKQNKKKLILWGMLIFSIAYYFCLPKTLFKDVAYSTVIFSKEKKLLSAIVSSEEQWLFPASTVLPEKYILCVVNFEDKRFWKHWGVDFLALGRAIKDNLKSSRVISGASTITMQTIRLHRKNPPRTIYQKSIEIILATRLEWKYSKLEILNAYANHAPFGGNVIGIEAAAWRYFGKSVENISWAEAALLAVLPNSPGLIHTEKNRDKLKIKRDKLLYKLLTEEIIESHTYDSAITELIPRKTQSIINEAPHFLQYQKKQSGPSNYYSTIQYNLQSKCNQIARSQGKLLKQNFIDNLAILVLDIETNETIAYVGNLPETGMNQQEYVDIIQAPRSTGSLLKPFLYTAALDEGLILEKTWLPDYPLQMNGFEAKNYNLKNQGLESANRAMIRSLNIPFAYLLQQYGIAKFLLVCQKLGLKSLNKSEDYYGIPLILGGGESTLWELTNAYGKLGKILNTYNENDGYYAQKDLEACELIVGSAYDKKTKLESKAIFFQAENIWTTLNNLQELVRPDEQGEWKNFDSNRKIAWKTGTSNGFKDAWAIGVNGKYAIGVWVGNADGEGRPGVVGSKAAAPIFFQVVNILDNHKWFTQPIDDQKFMATCATSGYLPNPYCPLDSTWVSSHAENVKICPYHERIYLDETEKYKVSADYYDMSKAKSKSFLNLPSTISYYYSQHALYEKIPPNHPESDLLNIGLNQKNEAPKIIYPERKMKIYQPKLSANERNNFVLKSFHKDENAIIYWHIDDQYLGRTEKIHELSTLLRKGEHVLVIVDGNGNRDETKFYIVE